MQLTPLGQSYTFYEVARDILEGKRPSTDLVEDLFEGVDHDSAKRILREVMRKELKRAGRYVEDKGELDRGQVFGGVTEVERLYRIFVEVRPRLVRSVLRSVRGYEHIIDGTE